MTRGWPALRCKSSRQILTMIRGLLYVRKAVLNARQNYGPHRSMVPFYFQAPTVFRDCQRLLVHGGRREITPRNMNSLKGAPN